VAVVTVIPLNNFPGPADDTVTAHILQNTEYRIQNTVLARLFTSPGGLGFWIWVSPSSSPPHAAHAHDYLFPLYM
jgi:hypothetical protein